MLDPAKLNLDISAPSAPKRTFPRAPTQAACGDQLAWFYDNPVAPAQIHLCPAACDAIGGGETVEIQLGCDTLRLQ